jgi:hypothetical protein
LLSIPPIDAVEPTPFQRDLSDAHHKRLADVINKTGRFLDPIIAVVAPIIKEASGPRMAGIASKPCAALGRNQSLLVVTDREVAWQILALNTEKAHNLKERSPAHRASSVRIVGWEFPLFATKFFEMMVARDGVEPPTPAFSGLRSTT